MKSAAAALGPAASYLCTPEAHGNAPNPSEGDAGQCDGGTAGRGPGPGEVCEGRREEKDRGRESHREERERKTMKEKKTLSENFQQLPTFGYLTTNLPVQHINTLTHTSYTG